MEKRRTVKNLKEELCYVGNCFLEWLRCEKILKFKGYNPQSEQQLLCLYFGLWKVLGYKNPSAIYVPFYLNGVQNIVFKLSYLDDY